MADRADPAQDLLDRVGQQSGVGAELLPLAGVLGEGEEAAADRVAGRLVARLDQQLAVREELFGGQRLPVELAGDEPLTRSSRGSLPALARPAARSRRAARPGPPNVWPGVSPARRYSGSSLPMISLVQRNSSSQSPRAHRGSSRSLRAGTARRCARRSRARRGAGGRGGVDDLGRDAFDVALRSRTARGLNRGREPAHGSVPRRVEHDDHLGPVHRRAGGAQCDAWRGREPHGLLRDLDDVGVLRDRPERLEAGRVDVRDRILVAQTRPDVVRIASAR